MNPHMVCVDASLAAKWVLWEQDRDMALGLLQEWRRQETEIIAPPHLPIEVSNAIYQRMRRRDLKATEARSALKQFLKIRIRLATSDRLYSTAFNLAVRLGLPSLYDAHYLALAKLSRCEVWTADRKLFDMTKQLTWIKFLTG